MGTKIVSARIQRLGGVGSWIVVACALVTTALVVRREFLQGDTAAEPKKLEATYVSGWKDTLAVGLRTGPAEAPVQVVEFADFQCPSCARFEPTIRALRAKYPSQIAVTLVHFPLPQHNFAEQAARAAECANLQGAFESMRSLLFERQKSFGAVPWLEFAREVGVPDLMAFDECASDTQPVQRIEQGMSAAETLQIRSTPTILINGWKLPRPPSMSDFDKIVKNVAAGKKPITDASLSQELAYYVDSL
jgi:protein-disulfide isomerase